MTAVSALNNTTASTASQVEKGGLRDVNIDEFLKLMVAELQNQDPLDPMKNSEMLQQLSQMRSIGATDKLTATLDAVLMGQNLTTASSLIGKQVNALTDAGSNVQGLVDRVSVVPADKGRAGSIRVHVGNDSVALGNVREILPGATP